MFYNRNKEYSVEYLLLAITICLQFYRLGIGEIQPWDEALYCVRANICLQFGSWIDQTQYAVGGLYSSTHPPLGIWGIALGKYILGDATYAPRVFVAVCSLVSLFYVYKLAIHLTSRRTALISTIVFGNAQIWLWYAHHAQLDVPMHTAVVACLYYTVRSMEGNRSSTILAGVFFGAALLLKAFQAIYILPLLLLLSYILVNTNRLKRISTIITVAFIISSPWYIMMAIQHQEFFSEWMGLFSSLASGTYRVTTGNWWYYLNQVIVNYPFSLLLPFVIYSLRNLFLTKRRFSTQDKMLIVSILYFILMLVFVSVLRTNMPHFILFMSIPVMICTIFSINKVLNTTKSTPLLLSFFAVLIGVCWGGSEQIRMYVKGNESFTFLYNTTNLILVGTAYLLVAYLII